MKPEDVVNVLASHDVTSYQPLFVCQVLELRNLLDRQGCDSLMYEDGELILALIKWKRDI